MPPSYVPDDVPPFHLAIQVLSLAMMALALYGLKLFCERVIPWVAGMARRVFERRPAVGDEPAAAPGASMRSYLCTVLAATAAMAVAVCFLPHDKRVRYQALRGSIHERAGWVYDRIHNDPTPVDMVIVGSSRAAAAFDQVEIGHRFSQAYGSSFTVANFSFAQVGLDLSYAVLKDTLETRTVRDVVLGVTERQARTGHPAFKDLADAEDLLAAPVVFNLGYFGNLASLPMRQLTLSLRTSMPALFGSPTGSGRDRYAGAGADVRHLYPVVNEAEGMARSGVGETFDEASRRYFRTGRKRYLPESLGRYEFASVRSYVAKIKDLVERHGARLTLVYLPFYKATPDLIDEAYLAAGTVLVPPPSITTDPANFLDPVHVNDEGARKMSAWFCDRYLKDRSDPIVVSHALP